MQKMLGIWTFSCGSKCGENLQKGQVSKWVQIAEERREEKGKGERKRYTQLNAEFQRTERRDKKAFLNEQCKEIEENNKMGKTRDRFKEIENIKGNFMQGWAQ